MTWPKLKNAPIREAVIDLKFANSISSESLLKLNSVLEGDYPKKDERYIIGVKASFKGKEHYSKSESNLDGYRLSNENTKFVVLTSINGITLSRLKPYTIWEEIRLEGQKVIGELFKLVPDIKVNRIALRYINEFEFLPELGKPIVGYFGILPIIPNGLPSNLEGYKINLQLPNPENDLNTILNIAMKTKDKSSVVSLLFDIDVFKMYDYGNKFGLIFEDLEIIRDYKNKIFYSTITEELKKLFN